MKKAVINPESCLNCTACAVEENCSKKAIIREDSSEKPWVDFYKCGGCLKCKAVCRGNAIQEIIRPCH